ncbi:hypothetical protein [Acinetobacter sp. Marseille-Q1618]|uniref:hypothetical protein n=1 Tax=Acinetobacter sp. Marseille-Q1618 TaxID=2697502 RepID=UPI00156EA7FA|nr:hypothetical protein [Acinetobacter sp. Marseille-Q1618]
MKDTEEKNLSRKFVDIYSTWGNPHNPYNVDNQTLVFYRKILDNVLKVILVIIVVLALVVFGMCIYMAINPDFNVFVFDDGSSAPCIYEPLTGKFRQ